MTRHATTMNALASAITSFCEVPSMRTTLICQEMRKSQRTTRRILMLWPRHRKKKQKLWHPWPQQTEHSVMRARNSIRYGCHVVTFLSNKYSVIVPNRRQERKCVTCSGPHWSSVCREARETRREEGRSESSFGVQQKCHGRAHRNEHVRKRSTGNKNGAD